MQRTVYTVRRHIPHVHTLTHNKKKTKVHSRIKS